MEPDVLGRGVQVGAHIAAFGIEQTACAVAVLEVMTAAFAFERGSFAHTGEVPLAHFVAGVLAPFHVVPLVRLSRLAVRTLKGPLAHVGGLELPMGVVVFFTAL